MLTAIIFCSVLSKMLDTAFLWFASILQAPRDKIVSALLRSFLFSSPSSDDIEPINFFISREFPRGDPEPSENFPFEVNGVFVKMWHFLQCFSACF